MRVKGGPVEEQFGINSWRRREISLGESVSSREQPGDRWIELMLALSVYSIRIHP